MVQGLGGKVMLQYTGLAKKNSWRFETNTMKCSFFKCLQNVMKTRYTLCFIYDNWVNFTFFLVENEFIIFVPTQKSTLEYTSYKNEFFEKDYMRYNI